MNCDDDMILEEEAIEPKTALYHCPSVRASVPHLLATRQQYGNVKGRLARHRGSCVTPTKLSLSVAWNVPRMHNMILAVGPGTPATTAMVNDDDDDDDDEEEKSDDTRIDSNASHESEEGDEEGQEDEVKSEEDETEEEKETARDDDGEEEKAENNDDNDNDRGQELSGRAKWLMRAVADRVDEHADEEEHQAQQARRRIREVEGDDHSENEEDENRETAASGRPGGEPLDVAHRAIMEWMEEADADDDDDFDQDDDDDDFYSERQREAALQRQRQKLQQQRSSGQQQLQGTPSAPSMRHGGCINTAVWMDCPWRLSIACSEGVLLSSSHSSNDESFLSSNISNEEEYQVKSVASQDCPTQLITSGDDRVVKFWDVRHAMGTSTPLPGGMNCVNPFSNPTVPSPQETAKSWKEYYKMTSSYINSPTPNMISGMVIPLVTLPTGHRGNVFHATPLVHHPGKIATCGADGYLRVADLESSSSSPATSIIVSPEYDNDALGNVLPAGLLSLRPGMCFSHHFINANVGLLCSERGLRRFDLRLNPREQQTRSILGGPYRTCKACAVWSASSTPLDDVDSAYVFAGGSSGDVALYDLRMTDGSGSRVVQHYRPRGIGPDASVSVSGLDISRDKRELLVSYENDQIYSFPIFPKASCAAGPTVDELAAASRDIDGDDDETSVLRELACYGGHLNRFTFLKNAKYAGLQDEYICTGSDSGHAWIYERSSGSVVSLLNADHSTCNGVVPHPVLPFFVTYGIDSTAKLWRATVPVDHNVDDSPLGRARCFNKTEYDKSPLVGNWKNVQTTINSVDEGDNPGDTTCAVLPDQVPSRDDELERNIFESLGSIFFRSRRGRSHGPGGPYIGNNLRNLPEVLRQNLFACIRAQHNGDDEPVRSGICELKRRIGAIRLRHQADERGLLWDSSVPWIMQARENYIGKETYQTTSSDKIRPLKSEVRDATLYGQRSDLVPDCPSDWIPYDPEMTSKPLPSGMNFNLDDYEDFYNEQYGPSRYNLVKPLKRGKDEVCGSWAKQNDVLDCKQYESKRVQTNGVHDKSMRNGRNNQLDTIQNGRTNQAEWNSSSEDDTEVACEVDPEASERSWQLLHDSALLLKESGNAALQAGAVNSAARKYDKVIQYCAIAFTSYPSGNIAFVKRHHSALLINGGHEDKWRPLLKLLITTRLNLSMTMLKPEIADTKGAAEQAQQALLEVKPFVVKKGKVMLGRKLDREAPGDEPLDTFREAKELQAKAYFRLGTAQYASKDFAAAVRSFEHSIKSTKEACDNAAPEAIVLRRLSEAKRENAKKKKRHRKKFKLMLAESEGEEETEEEEGKDGENR